MLQSVTLSDIVNRLDESDSSWFTELILEEKNYKKPEETLQYLIRVIHQQELESQRQQLQKEVILMQTGQLPMNSRKKQLYEELNKQLKGTR